MKRKLIVSVAAAVLVAATLAPAQAQLINPFGTDAVGISREDAERLRAAVRGVLEQYTLSARQDWQSPSGQRAGTATITKLYTSNGMRCAMVQHAFTKGPGHPYHAPMCEVSGGEWKLAF